MRAKRLGRDGPEISVVGFGAWEAGLDDDPEAQARSIEAIRAGVDAGMNWVDTAEAYGSESLVGRALEGRPDVMVFTKFFFGMHEGPPAEEIPRAAEESARRLGRDVIDLYQLHAPDRRYPVEEQWEAMAALAAEGRARRIGVSNFDADQLERCERIRHVDSVQNHFSLIHRAEHGALAPLCARNGSAFLAYGVFALGLLGGKIRREDAHRATSWGRATEKLSSYQRSLFGPDVLERHLDYVERVRPVAERAGVPLPALALAWAIARDDVTVAIAGSTKAENTRRNASAAAIQVDEAIFAELDALTV